MIDTEFAPYKFSIRCDRCNDWEDLEFDAVADYGAAVDEAKQFGWLILPPQLSDSKEFEHVCPDCQSSPDAL